MISCAYAWVCVGQCFSAAVIGLTKTTDSIFTSNLSESIWHSHTDKQLTECGMSERRGRKKHRNWWYCFCYLHPSVRIFIFCIERQHSVFCTEQIWHESILVVLLCIPVSHLFRLVIILYSIWISLDLFVHHIFIHFCALSKSIYIPTQVEKKSQLKHILLPENKGKTNRTQRIVEKNITVRISSFPGHFFYTALSMCAFHIYLIIYVL